MERNRGQTASGLQESWDRLAFRNWTWQAFLSPEEERHRQTVCRLAQALDLIIREELSPSQRRMLERYWFEGEKPAQIARDTGLNRSTISRTLHRAQESIYSHLKYAVLALNSEKAEPDFLQAVSQASQVLAAAGQAEDTIGGRIRKLRMQHALTKKQLAAALSADEAAVSRWERDVELPDTVALMRMARLFSVRADDLLFGFGEGEALISPGHPCTDIPPEANAPSG